MDDNPRTLEAKAWTAIIGSFIAIAAVYFAAPVPRPDWAFYAVGGATLIFVAGFWALVWSQSR